MAAVKRIYGLEWEEYRKILDDQDNACAICQCEFGVKERDTHVDHCHKTGEVRGLLCPPCNQAIGLLGDDPEILERALDYVRQTN
jgi:hypothetical protein